MNKGRIYILNPNASAIIPKDEIEHIKQRNHAYGIILSRITKLKLSKVNIANKIIDKNDIIITPTPLDPKNALKIGIKDRSQLLGAICNPILGSKIILHPILTKDKKLKYFPTKFQQYLEKNQLVSKGFSVFDPELIPEALEKLKKKGVNNVRFKPGWASGGSLQSNIINQNFSHLSKFIESNKSLIEKEGIVLESNLTNSITHSGGFIQIKINGELKRYSYVGKQMFCNMEQFGIRDKYVGTVMTICKGDSKNLAMICGKMYKNVIQILQKIEIGIEQNLSKELICTRMNFDLIAGNIENTNNRNIFLTDHSFRPGAATLSELLGINEIESKKISHCNVMNKLTINGQEVIPKTAEIIYRGELHGCKDVLVWGSIINTL